MAGSMTILSAYVAQIASAYGLYRLVYLLGLLQLYIYSERCESTTPHDQDVVIEETAGVLMPLLD